MLLVSFVLISSVSHRNMFLCLDDMYGIHASSTLSAVANLPSLSDNSRVS